MEIDGFDNLVKQARAGDRGAMDKLLDALRPHMERIAREYTDPGQAAESVSDLVQEAGLRAWQRLEQFRGGAGDAETLAMLRSWIAQIVRTIGINAREARNTRRRKAPRGAVVRLGGGGGDESSSTSNGLDSPADSGPTPSANACKNEQADQIQAALDKLPDPAGRDIVRLCFFEGLSLRQVAERIGLTYDQVRERYHAALRKLERELKGQM